MKFVNNCTAALAAVFTQNFLSTRRYHPDQTTLPDYLSTTGVLVSMCLGPCDNSEGMFRDSDHESGSWLQNGTTGARVFWNEGVGIILDPRAVSINCVYPLDAATNGREQAGCGPLQNYGSKFNKWQMLFWVYWRKITKFGYRMKWEDIPCSEFLELDPDYDPPVLMDHNNTWKHSSHMFLQYLQSLIGHEICYEDSEEFNFDNPDIMLLYGGPTPWRPSEWQDCTDTSQIINQEHSKSFGIWNEVVMEKPAVVSKVVQAVFYVNPNNKKLAYFEAESLGLNTVLEMDPFDPENLFRCPPAKSEDSEFASIS